MISESLPRERLWRPVWPCPVGEVLSVARRGPGDPTYRVDPDGTIWRGTRTPAGIATLKLSSRPHAGEVYAAAWGPGAEHGRQLFEHPFGADDDPSGFEPRHRAI